MGNSNYALKGILIVADQYSSDWRKCFSKKAKSTTAGV